jgi:hypothetical protein
LINKIILISEKCKNYIIYLFINICLLWGLIEDANIPMKGEVIKEAEKDIEIGKIIKKKINILKEKKKVIEIEIDIEKKIAIEKIKKKENIVYHLKVHQEKHQNLCLNQFKKEVDHLRAYLMLQDQDQ